MSTDIITGNDLKAILGEVLPASQGVFCELIWTNPNGNTNLTCTMGETDSVTPDKSPIDYDGLIVEFRNFYNTASKTTDILFRRSQGMTGRISINAPYSNPTINYARAYWPNTDGTMHFSDCTRYSSSAASVVGSDTGCLVPLRIYGFKLHGAPRQATEIDGLLDTFYPIGSYYETSDISFDPNISWGGTWSKVTEGYFLQATETAANVGTTVAAGLPNITGSITASTNAYYQSAFENDGTITKTGAFTDTTFASRNGFPDASSNYSSLSSLNFDASDSNSIYGNSTTVQPPAILVYIWHRTA